MRHHLALLALAASLTACSSSNGPNNGGGGGNSTLTVSNATPGSGNGALTGISITVDTNAAVQQGPAVLVVITGAVGGVQHSISLNFLKSDASIPNLEHSWGTDLNAPDGFTLCDAGGVVGSPCAPTAGVVDVAQRTITFTALGLTAALADGDASTLDGVIQY
ncbi:MAG: hypothetical protein IPI38_11955 [Gemmatimonadetes bacterium]|jgi:hypothetical protein|nr:hypothetical protein [Gemmatimonadota bacterium]MBP6669968.1 hypothetical protein [Gemmatimonadales bacterium]MBK6781092.1 hypothetical protein [Gemmatimonadota bacterium]MBK7716119.1 hypothetical protein [Gemmatimonadota bacterium]MBK7922889.1 hypothetical protein [Gemmatimonadota bacterium]